MDRVNKNSILAGMLIGLGVISNTISENKYIGALLFSLALLAIIDMKLQLCTGQIGFCLQKKNPFEYYFLILLYNSFGSSISILLAITTTNNDNTLSNKFVDIANYKFSRSYLTLFACGLLCGVLIFVAVYSKNIIVIILCIMTFILCGYEHCIADMPFLVLNFSIQNFIKEILIILGNSIGSIMTYWLIRHKKLIKS